MEAENVRPTKPVQRSDSKAWPVIALLLLVVMAIGGYMYWRVGKNVPVAPAEPNVVTAERLVESVVETPAPPMSRPNAVPAAEPLPALADSDTDVLAALGRLTGSDTTRVWLRPEHVIERIVATVDALPRPRLALRVWPLKPVAGEFTVVDTQQGKVIAAENAARYVPYVRAFDALDSEMAVAAYRHWQPLFQSAYRQLGYPDSQFNDRLLVVIDHLLAAPTPPEPLAVQFNGVLYEYVDPALQSASVGHKLMLRMGADNARTFKRKLKRIRVLLIAKPESP
ncbi:MAG: DUF3014 domain-containing protein [Xanthomonadaceae bacterium]|nr:DUF3014 domain-containing protein [Xanthomonadaceae bacterium]MDP2184773.1 DUF3014 domain-containing protein [Xanthomonadales bacterium]MDZ4115128.1 DUF3014 domain-containing protein [Xanthomonadaceae bacterium]MDZ4376556.1 DUF3014 domain-containing protein [Xanthomonadaceae bacterium]